RLAAPNALIVGADSHSGTAGAVGAVAVPIGSNELATVLATGQLWMRVPESICIRLDGQLPQGVMVRDIDFKILGDFGTEFATYHAVEFTGSSIERMTVIERSVLANAGIEMGAKNAIVPGDRITDDW